jgi:hypothetical protein
MAAGLDSLIRTMLPEVNLAAKWLGPELCSGFEAGLYLRLVDSVYH